MPIIGRQGDREGRPYHTRTLSIVFENKLVYTLSTFSFSKRRKVMQAAINNHEVYYTTLGHGRPMLLLHGGTGLDHTYFRPWLDALSDQLQLIFYDLYGHGRSTRPQSFDDISMDTWVAEADVLRAYLGHERNIML